jgi:ATP synthase protein I
MQEPINKNDSLPEQIRAKADRKISAQNNKDRGIWFGLGMMGLVGWSIAIPTLLGASLGLWLDKHYDDERSWTLVCLLAGLVTGCFTAWNWLSKEHKNIDDDK